MLFVVGLGNPGEAYAGTRHNVGFEVIGILAQRHGFPAPRRFKGADVRRGRIDSEEVMLVEPMTYMNLSGDAVGNILRYYRSDSSDVIVVHDELDFDPGELKLKMGGGHGGHNGLRSIMSHIGSNFARVRIGVGKPPKGRGADHVLSRFAGQERQAVDDAVALATEAIECIVVDGIRSTMNRMNRRQAQAQDKKESGNQIVGSMNSKESEKL